ncbi:LAME_0F08108g1_1 [Lachancea meyersii CBS 8951]|uniref:LAME_0F08108g1_1 n=1 Tax=Lachancea meyersii CBS 8951 TaxID=1266667 RepID=A0A1G4JUG2_9SACH|nr:LAME_0F08108g1_1 [Lachancea meyersii CBS 8951]
MNGARILDETSPIRKRKTYNFRTIKHSKFYKSLKHLPELASSKQLTHDAIFREVQAEFRQVKSDVASIESWVAKDLSLETSQMSKIELKLKSSLKRFNHQYKKISRRRAARESQAQSQSDECTKTIAVLENDLRLLHEQADSFMRKVASKESELPAKYRLLNKLSFNKRHYPLLHELLESLSPMPVSPEDQLTRSSDNSISALEDSFRDISSNLEAPSPDPIEVPVDTNNRRHEATRKSLFNPASTSGSVIFPPDIISARKISTASPALVSTSYHQATRSDFGPEFTGRSDTSSSLHSNLNVRK